VQRAIELVSQSIRRKKPLGCADGRLAAKRVVAPRTTTQRPMVANHLLGTSFLATCDQISY
jgi:hypothetical protein